MPLVVLGKSFQGAGMAEERVGLLGATSLVGECLLNLLSRKGLCVTAFSRRPMGPGDEGIEWRQLPDPASARGSEGEAKGAIASWICAAPIWVLPDLFGLLEAYGARRVVALSSTSRFTKGHSSDPAEQAVARRLSKSETTLQNWAEYRKVEWTILRPTLIYGLGRDKNITEIMNFISRFGFFPLLGRAQGLRQPVHAEDVAQACLAALKKTSPVNNAYNLSGGETLPYREMVRRVFTAMKSPPHLVTVPLWAFRLALLGMHLLPRYRHWTAAMAQRMNSDLVFDSSGAVRDLKFCPRPFKLAGTDFPDSVGSNKSSTTGDTNAESG